MRASRANLRFLFRALTWSAVLLIAGLWATVAPAATVKTRVTGAANWNTPATWLQIRTGTVTFTNGSATVTGSGTLFSSELQAGDVMVLDASPGTVRGTILSIQSNTQLTLTANASANANGAFGRQRVPDSGDDVQIGHIALSSGITLTLDVSSTTVSSLNFIADNLANVLVHSGTNALTVTNDVTINQPTGGVTVAWNINAGTGTVNGNLKLGGSNTSTNRIARIAITTGTLNLNGNLVFNSSSSTAVTAVIDMSGGAGNLLLAGTFTLTNGSGTLTPGTTSTFTYNGTGAQTVVFASSITYNHLKIDKTSGTATLGANTTAGGDLILNQGTLSAGASNFNLNVGGNWTNNGGAYSGGSGTVTLTGASKTITGTTTFPGLSIGSGARYTMNNDQNCTSLTFVASGAASSLTQGSGTALTVNGAVTINQPTGAFTTAWNINAATATVSGLITFAGANTTTTRVGKIVITTGTLHANGGITFVASAAATKVIEMSAGAGTLNLKGALTVPAASSTLTAGTAGSIFNYADTSAAQTVNFFSAGAYHNLHLNNTNASGATLSANITTLNVTGNLRVQTGTFSNGGFAIAGNAARTFEVANGATFRVAGATSAFPSGFGTFSLGATSTVNFSGTGAQTVAAQNYGHLTISTARGANNVTLVSSGTIGVAGAFSVTATFNSGNGFVSTGSTVSYNGSSTQTVAALSPMVAGNNMYNHLTISNAGDVTMGGNVTVGGTLTFSSGNIITGANTIYVNSTGTVSRTSGHVIGNFKQFIATGATSKTFEIGDASAYTPVSISFSSVTVAGDLTLSTTGVDHPNLGASTINSAKTVNRYWTATNTGITFTNYSVTLNFVAGDVDAGANTANVLVGRYSGSWSYPVVGTRTATSTQATGLTSFGDLAIGESAIPNLDLLKTVDPSGSQTPGTDLTYTLAFTNSGSSNAQNLVITNPVPPNTDFKVGSVADSLGTTGLTVLVTYSNDNGSTWTYSPASAAGGADPGYDRLVTDIRWTFTGNLSQTSPNNTGSVSFVAKIR